MPSYAKDISMRIKQSDFRTVEIRKKDLSFFLRYSLFWNGEERLPASITSREDYVIAYFLTSTIRDCFFETENGISIERSWSIIPPGDFTLSFCLDFQGLSPVSYLFPCTRTGLPASSSAGDIIPAISEKETICVPGEQTSYPCSLFIYADPASVLIFLDPPKSDKDLGNICLKKVQIEDEKYLRVELYFPPADKSSNEEQVFHSQGGFEYGLRLNVVTSSQQEIHKQGLTAALKRIKNYNHAPLKNLNNYLIKLLSSGIRECLSRHLFSKKGFYGLRRTANSSILSSYASAGLSLIINKHFAHDKDLIETSLRLADFSLQGQHPSGLFFESFSLEDEAWIGINQTMGKRKSGIPVISLEQAAGVSVFLIKLVDQIKAKGLYGKKYIEAASRLIGAFFDTQKHLTNLGSALLPDSLMPVKSGPGVLELISPLIEFYKLTGRDYYKKAILTMRDKYFYNVSPPLPVTSDSRTALLLAKNAVLLSGSGFRVENIKVYFNLLLPWIYLNRKPSTGILNTMGGTLESTATHRLLFQGFEYSYLLLSLDSLITGRPTSEWIKGIVGRLIGFSIQQPLGTSYIDSEGSIGPIDTHRFVREAYYLLKVMEEFPGIIPLDQAS